MNCKCTLNSVCAAHKAAMRRSNRDEAGADRRQARRKASWGQWPTRTALDTFYRDEAAGEQHP